MMGLLDDAVNEARGIGSQILDALIMQNDKLDKLVTVSSAKKLSRRNVISEVQIRSFVIPAAAVLPNGVELFRTQPGLFTRVNQWGWIANSAGTDQMGLAVGEQAFVIDVGGSFGEGFGKSSPNELIIPPEYPVFAGFIGLGGAVDSQITLSLTTYQLSV